MSIVYVDIFCTPDHPRSSAGFADCPLLPMVQVGCGPTATVLAPDPFGCGGSRSGTVINITGNQRARHS